MTIKYTIVGSGDMGQEHIHNIEELFSNLNRMLTIDGILLIAVPNLKAPENTFYSTNWAPFDAPRHLYHFQLETLDNLMKKSNFKIVRKYSLFQEYEIRP